MGLGATSREPMRVAGFHPAAANRQALGGVIHRIASRPRAQPKPGAVAVRSQPIPKCRTTPSPWKTLGGLAGVVLYM